MKLIVRVSYLLLLVCTTMLTACSAQHRKKNHMRPIERPLTVAAIQMPKDGDEYIEVSFLESARFYRLPKNAAPQYLQLLKESEAQHKVVLIKRANEYSDVILRVRMRH